MHVGVGYNNNVDINVCTRLNKYLSTVSEGINKKLIELEDVG